jgi:hypothetical protein
MSATLVDNVRSAFSADVLSKIAVLLGETEGNAQKAVHAAVSLVLTDILHKSYYPEQHARIWELSRQATTGDFFGQLHELKVSAGSLLPGSILLNQGTQYAKSLLGARLDPVVNETGRYGGVSLPSAGFITGVVSFAALDAIGRHIATYNADATGLAQWLKTEAGGIGASVPSGLELKQTLGIERFPWETPVRRRRNTAVYIAIVLILIGAAVFFVLNAHHRIVSAGSPHGVLTMLDKAWKSSPAVVGARCPLS